MLFEEKQEQKQQEQKEVKARVVQQEEPDWLIDERMREEIARQVEEKLQLAKRVLETERALELVRSPKDTIRLAKEAADQLYEIVKRRPDWVVSIEGREFLAFPAWQLCATFFGLYPVVTEVREIRDAEGRVIGFHAVAVVRNRFGEEITRAEARADRNELMPEYERIRTPDGKIKRGKFLGYKPRFGEDKSDEAVMATAETRAMRRALWQVLNFVVGLAGYETEPAEEEETTPADEPVTPQDWARFWAQVKRLGYKPEEVHDFFGVKSLIEIVKTKSQLDNALEALVKAKEGDKQ
jgi:hypothetical protein